jgi:hypothetical protein
MNLIKYIKGSWKGSGLHAIGPISDYTICGLSLDGDDGDGDSGLVKVEWKKVTCKDCLTFINHCKSL